jgi:hypothetical protein
MADLKTFDIEHTIEVLKRKNDDLELQLSRAQHQAEQAILERHLTVKAVAAGVLPGATRDAVARALREWKWKVDSKGQVLRIGPDGQEVRDVSNEAETASVFQSIKTAMPSYFGDAQEQAAKSRQEPPNPWSRENWNVTKQSRVAAISLDEARRMAKAAGSSLDATQPPPPPAAK